MGARRKAREAALQMLYQLDAQRQPIASDLSEFWAMGSHPPEVMEYAERLVRAVCENLATIDAAIQRSSENWSLHRMDRVARSLLRLAACELLYMDDVPPKVAINEAVEIAKRYGAGDTAPFVNGILDRIMRELEQKVS